MLKLLSLFFSLVIFLSLVNTRVLASQIPDFSACANPGGILKVKYDNGVHGVVGEASTLTGSDAVYQLSADSTMQCFCANDGHGIQTNWWKISELSQNEISDLIVQGWQYVGDGSIWNLDKSAYLVKNTSYSCQGSSSSSSNSDPASPISSSENVAGASATPVGTVLALATTGNILTIYITLAAGLTFLASGVYLLFKSRQ